MRKNLNSDDIGRLGFVLMTNLILIILKLCGMIDWSWDYVLCPLVASIITAIVILLVDRLGL